MRIGEILLAHNRLREAELARALAEQEETGRRLCSMLIGRGLIEYDDAAQALAEQKGVPCAFQKHLELRDRDLEMKIPPELARACCALPIARTRSGDLIVVVRDPDANLLRALTQAARTRVRLLVTPATQLEKLVEQIYGGVPTGELDVDFDTGPIALPPKPDMTLLDPDSIQLALTSLDDDRVTKDPSQSGHMSSSMPAHITTPRTTAPPPLPAAQAPPVREPAPPTRVRSTISPTNTPSLETATHEIGYASQRDAATDIAMTYISRRWVAGVMLAIKSGAAVGYRGHGPQMPPVGSIAIPLGERSTIQRAAETRRTTIKVAEGTVEERVESVLGVPDVLAVAPVIVRGHVVALIAVGDPVLGSEDFDDATADLGLLAEALSGAYERIHTGR